MQTNSNSAILTALLAAMRPIARILMKAGIGYREFSEIAKCAFVDVATVDYGLRGRPTNISRVAVMTGLTRKEVKRLRVKIEAGSEAAATKVIPPMEIIHNWYADKDYLDAAGRPAELGFDGTRPSFSSLVKRYGGDIPPGAMRTELLRVNAIEETDGGKLRLTRRHYRPLDADKLIHHGFGQAISGLGHSLDHNITRTDSESWVQRVAVSVSIKKDVLPRVRRISQDRAEEFVANIDDLFSAYEEGDTGAPSNATNKVVGVGVYYFEALQEEIEFY